MNADVWVAVQRVPLDLAKAAEFLTCEDSGAMSLFVGTVRNHAEGKPVAGIDYDGYDDMILNVFRGIVAEIKSQWSPNRLTLLHRLGHLRLTEASVVVGVSCSHRREALDATRFAIDAIKKDAPIWKKEIFADSSAEWKGTPP